MMEDWQIVLSIVVPILGVLGGFLRHIHNSNKEAHRQIGENIKESKKELNESIKESEKRLAESVRTDVNRIYDQTSGSGSLGCRNRTEAV